MMLIAYVTRRAIIPLLLVCAVRVCSAYSLEGPKWPDASVVNFQLALGNANRTLSDGNTSWNVAASPGLGYWNQNVRHAQFTYTNSNGGAYQNDGINSIVFSTTMFGQNFGSRTLAVTFYRYYGSTMTEADILFNQNQSWDSYRGALRFNSSGNVIADVRRVFIHEVGHALGLNHPDDAGQHVDAIMNSVISDRDTLSADDINGARVLYGAPSPTPTPTPTPTPPPSLLPGPLIYWQNSSTGERQIWSMRGTTHTSTASLGSVATVWNIVASGDFNGDGKKDSSTGQIAIWTMNGATRLGSYVIGTAAPPWQVATASDFNGDGKSDLVLQNGSTGERAIWLMNGLSRVGIVTLGALGTQWKIIGSGDFDGDTKPDLLLWNTQTGQIWVWLMNGTTPIRTVALPTGPTTGWSLVGTSDLNSNGNIDILWQNQSNGQRAAWLMNRTTFLSTATIAVAPITWNIRNY
jgi:Matrixin/FG-GAP-like repeat/FG-GAP repeat